MLGRIVSVLFVILVCIFVFSSLVEFLIAVPVYLNPPVGSDVELIKQKTPLFAAFWWGLFFRGPFYVLTGTLPLLIICLLLDWYRLTNKWLYLGIWMLAGLAASQSIAAIPAGLASGMLYWAAIGRQANETRGKKEGFASKAISPSRVVAYGLLLWIGCIAVGYLWYGYKMIEVTFKEPSRGIPPFVSYDEGFRKAANAMSKKQFGDSARLAKIPDPGIFQKVALRDFPDPSSCMKGPNFVSKKYDLYEMDWDKINNEAEAEVCTFRLLKSLGGIENATPWLEAQGFKSSTTFTSSSPYKKQDDTLSVQAYHNIRENGPKFPTSGFIRRAFRSIPYSMSIVTVWSADGKELLYVRYASSTL